MHPSKILPMARIPEEQRTVALDLVYDRRREGYDPLQRVLELFEGATTAAGRATRAAELLALPLDERLQRRIIDGETQRPGGRSRRGAEQAVAHWRSSTTRCWRA